MRIISKRLVFVLLTMIFLAVMISGCSMIMPASEERAESLVDKDKIEQAIEMYEELIDEDEVNHELWEGLIKAYIEDEEFEDAAEIMEDWAEIIEEQAEAEDNDYEDGLEMYYDLAEDIIDEDDDIEIYQPRAGITLEEGQTHMTFTEDGELTMIVYLEDKEIEDDLDIDFADDEDDILDAIQDSMDDSFEMLAEMMDLDLEVEVTEFKKKGDFALVTVIFSDFEMMYMDSWFEKFEDLADDMGDYEELADEITFVTFKKGDEVDEDDLEDYEDGFTIMLDGMEEGAFYEFPGEIQIVDEDMKYERISDTIIFVEDGEEGYAVIDAEIDGEIFNPYADMDFGDLDLDDLDLDNIDLDDMDLDSLDIYNMNPEDLQALYANMTPAEIEALFGDVDMAYIEALFGDMDINDIGGLDMSDSNVGTVTFDANGSVYSSNFYSISDLIWEFNLDENLSTMNMQQAIQDYYDNYGIESEVRSLETVEGGVMLTIYTENANTLFYDYGSSLDDLISDYNGYEYFSESYTLVDYLSNEPINESNVSNFGNLNVVYLDGGNNGINYNFPSNIVLVDDNLLWERVDSDTIYVDYLEYGYVVFE